MDIFDKEIIYKMIFQIEENLVENGIPVKDLIKNEYFVNIFHQISDIVLKKESTKPKEFLINTIIKEIVKYISKNSSNFIQIVEEEKNQIKKVQKEYTSTFFCKNSKTLNLEKVKSISIKSLYIKDSTYCINKTNDTITIREKIPQSKDLYTENRTINIENGNYTKYQLISELNFKFSISELLHKYYFYSDSITNKICVTTFNQHCGDSENIISKFNNLKLENSEIFDIIYKDSSVLQVLGFEKEQELSSKSIYIGNFPLNLKRDDFIKLSVSVDEEKTFFMIKKDKKGCVYEKEIFKKKYEPFQKIEKISINLNDSVIHYDIDILVEVVYFQTD